MEPEGSLPCFQEPPIHPILSQMNQKHTLFLQDHLNIILSPSPMCLPRVSFSSGLGTKFLWISHLCYACYVRLPSHPLWFARSIKKNTVKLISIVVHEENILFLQNFGWNGERLKNYLKTVVQVPLYSCSMYSLYHSTDWKTIRIKKEPE
jgi:hypothetical protein